MTTATVTPIRQPTANDLLAAGSTLPLVCRPTIGVVLGGEWNGLCVRVGTQVLDASVVSRTEACRGYCDPTDDEAEDWVWAAIIGRLEDALRRNDAQARGWLTMHRLAVPDGVSPFRIALRRAARPTRMSPEGSANQNMAVATYGWLRHAYPAAVPVPWFKIESLHKRPRGTGVKADYYPPELIGGNRPNGWLPYDGQQRAKGERTAEQAAYHTAGLACLIKEDVQ